jgi:signal transduction histidine kinase
MAVLVGAAVAVGAVTVAALVRRRITSGRVEAIARACHELRGPLTAMRLGLELAARAEGGLSAAQLRALELELGRAALALDDLAAAGSPGSRCRGGPGRSVEVRDLLADSAEAWRPAAAAAGARIDARWAGAPASVYGERLRLAQATGNLIANAIEHGGGSIELRGRVIAGSVRIEVIDDGPGLPAPVAELASRARSGRGSRGRGLAIASSIARDHGGRLAAAPSERGARLVLELPATGGRGEAAGFDAGPRPTG